MTFEISPVAGPLTAPGEPFKKFIQFRWEGVNLGDGGVRVLNIVGNPDEISVTRGTGENANVVTIRKQAAPVPGDAIGWFAPVDDIDGIAAAENAGGSTPLFPYATNFDFYLGVVDYDGGTVSWDADIVDLDVFAPGTLPTFTDLGGGKARVRWVNTHFDAPFAQDLHPALVAISATIDGAAPGNTLEIAYSGEFAPYGEFAWQQVPP